MLIGADHKLALAFELNYLVAEAATDDLLDFLFSVFLIKISKFCDTCNECRLA